jgi:hypothetical protein
MQQQHPFYYPAPGMQGEASQYVNGAQRFAPTQAAATPHSNATTFAAPTALVSTVPQWHYVYPPAPPPLIHPQ